MIKIFFCLYGKNNNNLLGYRKCTLSLNDPIIIKLKQIFWTDRRLNCILYLKLYRIS